MVSEDLTFERVFMDYYAFSHLYNCSISSGVTFSPKSSTDSVLHQPKGEKPTLSVNHDELRHMSLKMFVYILK